MRYSIDSAEPKRRVPARYGNTFSRTVAMELAELEWARRDIEGEHAETSMAIVFWHGDGKFLGFFNILRSEFAWAMLAELQLDGEGIL